MQGAVLEWAQLQGAHLSKAELHGANLREAELQGADLRRAELQGADLRRAELRGADLRRAELQGSILERAQLQGADLRGAKLQGTELWKAQLQGADLRGIWLWRTALDAETNLGLADLRGASWQSMSQDEEDIRETIRTFAVHKPNALSWPGEDWQEDSKARLERLIAPEAQSDEPPVFALDGLLLVDDVDDPRWPRLDRTRLTTDERAYDEALVPFLADLSRTNPHIARGLATRVAGEELDRSARLARGLLDRAGPALPEDVRERLSNIASQPAAKD